MEDPRSEAAESARSLSHRQKEALCAELGLDMREVYEVNIKFGSGLTVVSWEGARPLNATRTADLLRKIAEAGDD